VVEELAKQGLESRADPDDAPLATLAPLNPINIYKTQ
jgi:hypothetical protein